MGDLGFVGIGIMGEGMVNNLIKSGRKLVIWNRNGGKVQNLVASNPSVRLAASPREVVEQCDITFSMLSNHEASAAVFPEMLEGISPGKSIVDCATLSPERMQEMEAAVVGRGGTFLEAPVSGSKGPAAKGELIFLTGGDQRLFHQVSSELDIMGKAKFFFGPLSTMKFR